MQAVTFGPGPAVVVLDKPLRLAQEALTLQRVKALPPAQTAFSAARRALFGLELLRRAGHAAGVPRRETLESYRVPQVDALGVVIACVEIKILQHVPRHRRDASMLWWCASSHRSTEPARNRRTG